MKKGTKKFLKAAGVVGAAATATYFLLGDAFYYITLTKKGMESPITQKFASPNDKPDDYTVMLNNGINEGVEWFNQIDKEKIVIPSTNFKKNLHADYIFAENPTDITVVLIHGYTSSPEYMGVYAKKYHEIGYNVLMPSLNGHADSEVNEITMGWNDRLDILDWIDYIVSENENVRILIHGVSMGAATTMMTTGEKLPENVKVAVADCGYTSVWDIFENQLCNTMNLPKFPMLYSASTANKVFSGFDFKEASSVEQLKKSVTPTLFIHGEKDDFVPYEMLDKVYDACASPKAKVSIPNAPHARNACADPKLYWDSVIEFISKYL